MPIVNLKTISLDTLLDLEREAEALVMKSLGERPDHESIPKDTAGNVFPTSLRAITILGVVIVLVVAGIVSAHHIMETTGSLLYFVMAEPALIIGTLSWTVLFRKQVVGRLMLASAIVVALALAFVGNWVSAAPVDSLLKILMVLAPPLFTIVMSQVLERVFMSEIMGNVRHRKEVMDAQRAYDRKAQDVRSAPEFSQMLATSIWEATVALNDFGRGKTERVEHLNNLPLVERRQIVREALALKDWFRHGDGQTDSTIQYSPKLTPRDENLPVGEVQVSVTERDGDGSVTDFRDVAAQHPEIFERHTRDEIAELYGVSTGFVSKVKKEVLG